MSATKYSLETLSVLVEKSDKKISDMDEKFTNLEEKIDAKFDNLAEKLDAQNEKFDKILCSFNTRISSHDTSIALVVDKSETQEENIEKLQKTAEQNNIDLVSYKKVVNLIAGGLAATGTVIGIIISIIKFFG